MKLVCEIGSIAHQPAGHDIFTQPINRRNPVARHQADYLHIRAAEEWSPSDEEGVEALALNGGKDRIDLAARYGVENTDLQTDGAGSFLHAAMWSRRSNCPN
jgi:hypothetical protein